MWLLIHVGKGSLVGNDNEKIIINMEYRKYRLGKYLHRTCDGPSPELMMTHFVDAYMLHSTTMCWFSLVSNTHDYCRITLCSAAITNNTPSDWFNALIYKSWECLLHIHSGMTYSSVVRSASSVGTALYYLPNDVFAQWRHTSVIMSQITGN